MVERGAGVMDVVFESQQALGEFRGRFRVVVQPRPSLRRGGGWPERMAGTSPHLSSFRSRCRRRNPLVREVRQAILWGLSHEERS